ncbi:hypothetical protein EJB05_05305, partial [Eragrostis curvula]
MWGPLSVFPIPTHEIPALHGPVPLSHTTIAAAPIDFQLWNQSLPPPRSSAQPRPFCPQPPVALLHVPRWLDPRRLDSWPWDLQGRSAPPSGSTAAASGPRRDPPRAHPRDGPASSPRSMGTRPKASTMAQDGRSSYNSDCFWKLEVLWWGRWEVL